MKVRYVQTIKPIMLPGPGQSQKWQANGLDGHYKGLCKSITQDDRGYLIEIGKGANAGLYHVPFTNVEHAKLEPESVDAGIKTPHAIAHEAGGELSPDGESIIFPNSDAMTGVHAKPQRKSKTPQA